MLYLPLAMIHDGVDTPTESVLSVGKNRFVPISTHDAGAMIGIFVAPETYVAGRESSWGSTDLRDRLANSTTRSARKQPINVGSIGRGTR